MSGITADIERFDCWIGDNYNKLQSYCKKYHIPSDTLNDAYLNIRSRIQRSGFTQNYFMTYIKHTITNMRINEGKKNNNKFFIDIENPDFENMVEQTLIDMDDTDRDTKEYNEDVMYFSKKMFEYITNIKRYSDEELFIFRSYYLMPTRFTYEKLTAMTGINKNRCTKTIQTIKGDIKVNFLTWLNTQEKIQEHD